jgi:predicted  nucleic acid-binding Zn-ribbon protein
MSAKELQIAINEATTQKNAWSADLMRLNTELGKAKLGARASLRKAIRNAEQQISDSNRLIKKLNDDLANVLKAEVKNEDNLELAKQGISPGAQIAQSVGNIAQSFAPVIAGNLASKRSADAIDMPEQQKLMSTNIIYVVIAGIILLLMMKRK